MSLDSLQHALLLMLFVGVVHGTLTNLSCIDQKAIERQQQCFLDVGIELKLPTYNIDDSAFHRKQTYIETVISQQADLICAKPKEYGKGLECALRHVAVCMPADFQGYLPEPTLMPKMVATLCTNKTQIDFECAKNKASELFDCGLNKARETFSRDRSTLTAEYILCKAFQFSAQCQLSELRSCGCSTLKPFVTVSRDFLYPPRCPAFNLPKIECSPSNDALYLHNPADSGSASTRLALPGFVVMLIFWLLR